MENNVSECGISTFPSGAIAFLPPRREHLRLVLLRIDPVLSNVREFKKLLRRERQRERPKTIGFNEKKKDPARVL